MKKLQLNSWLRLRSYSLTLDHVLLCHYIPFFCLRKLHFFQISFFLWLQKFCKLKNFCGLLVGLLNSFVIEILCLIIVRSTIILSGFPSIVFQIINLLKVLLSFFKIVKFIFSDYFLDFSLLLFDVFLNKFIVLKYLFFVFIYMRFSLWTKMLEFWSIILLCVLLRLHKLLFSLVAVIFFSLHSFHQLLFSQGVIDTFVHKIIFFLEFGKSGL